MNISDLQGQGKMTISCKCDFDSSLELTLSEILNIIKSKRKEDQNIMNKEGFGNIEDTIEGCECKKNKESPLKHLFSDYFCIDCMKWICQECRFKKTNYHYLHRILKSRNLIQYIKDIIKSTVLKNKKIDTFEKKWDEYSNVLQTVFDQKFNTAVEKLDKLIESAQKLKEFYIEEYEKQIKNFIKTFKIIKLLYLSYYIDKEAELNKKNMFPDIFKLKYISKISNEFKSFSMNHSQELEKKVDKIKEEIDDLKKSNTKIIEAKFQFEKIDKSYQIDEILVGHKAYISSLIFMDDKIISGARDYNMRIWEKNEDGLYTIKQEVKTKAIISLLGLKNGKILLSSSGTNQIMIYEKNEKGEYICTQSISNSNNAVTSMAELEDKKVISCSQDGIITIWEENEKLKQYMAIQTIKTQNPILLLIALDDFKIAYTNIDNGIISILKAETQIILDKLVSKEFSIKGDLKKVKGKVSCMCRLNNGYFASGGADISKTIIDHNIYIWEPEGDSFILCQTVKNAHNTDVSSLLLLRNGNIASASKDRTVKIWSIVNPSEGVIQVISKQKLDHYGHGLFKIIQLNDDRLAVSASDNNIVFYKNFESIF
jgi:WD40 repeat protein